MESDISPGEITSCDWDEEQAHSCIWEVTRPDVKNGVAECSSEGREFCDGTDDPHKRKQKKKMPAICRKTSFVYLCFKLL